MSDQMELGNHKILFSLQKAVINTGITGFQKAGSEKLCSLDELAICVFQKKKKKSCRRASFKILLAAQIATPSPSCDFNIFHVICSEKKKEKAALSMRVC